MVENIVMQRKQAPDRDIDKAMDLILDQPRLQERVTSLAPYIAEIERRKKLRGLAKQSKKNLNQSSSRSFRIKQKSLSSLHKETFLRTRQTTVNTIVSRLHQNKINREQRAKSLKRNRELQSCKTIEARPNHGQSVHSNTFFKELYVRVKSKVGKDPPAHQSQHQTLEVNHPSSGQEGYSNLERIACTNPTNIITKTREDRSKQQKPKKNNFRRNKYEVEPQMPVKVERVESHSDGMGDLGKKESNVSLNTEMDKLAHRQMERYYKQVRNKQIHRSVEHHTEQYFNNESYRPIKSKNDIEVFVSIAKNPLLQRSQPTQDQNSEQGGQFGAALIYDFDFPAEETKWKKVIIENPSMQSHSAIE